MASIVRVGSCILALLSLMLAGCEFQDPPAGTAQTYATANAPDANAPFRLGSGDRIRVKVFGADQISGDYDIDLSGGLALPLAGTIHAAGKTPAELGNDIAAQLREQHLVDKPQVSIEVIATRPFYILGEVEKPGEYPYRAGLNIVSAVATAGGFRYRADQDFVYVRRGGQGPEIKVPFASAAPIFPGDIIRVPAHYF
ncbi:MAG TPA: polysaccharide biosynthesis/export family protein [Stellaceae bacterium]|nr:polysaccharide biosynthesis/export family protein [Stellaceae bacterium]